MTAKVKTPLEENVEGYLVRQIEARGGMALKGAVPGRRFIDRICVLPYGITAFVELKRPKGGVRSAHQIETIRRLKDEMHHVAVFLKTREEVDMLLRELDVKLMWGEQTRQMFYGDQPMTATEALIRDQIDYPQKSN